jgi:hypothetical protein
MAVRFQFITLIVPLERIRQVPGLRERLKERGLPSWEDEHLWATSSMGPVGDLVEYLESEGLVPRDFSTGVRMWKTVCVVDAFDGPTNPCPWIEVDILEQIAWKRGTPPGEVRGLTPTPPVRREAPLSRAELARLRVGFPKTPESPAEVKHLAGLLHAAFVDARPDMLQYEEVIFYAELLPTLAVGSIAAIHYLNVSVAHVMGAPPPGLDLLQELQTKAPGARAFEMRMRPDNTEHRLMFEDAPQLGSPEAILENLAARYIPPISISPAGRSIEGSLWVAATLENTRVLGFAYADPKDGPSIKGAPFTGMNFASAVNGAMYHADVTVRLSGAYSHFAMSRSDATEIGLSPVPPWFDARLGKPVS